MELRALEPQGWRALVRLASRPDFRHAFVVDLHHGIAHSECILPLGSIAYRIGTTFALEVMEAEALFSGDHPLAERQLDEALPSVIKARLLQRLAVLGEEEKAPFRSQLNG